MDTVDVIDIIPEDWLINSIGETNLYNYLYASMSHSLHQIRTAKIKKNLSRMDHETVENEWMEKRKASVRISNERVCAACKKKISDRVIVVYPNGIVVHFT
jgi:galactokinase/mevalonate kinase-like predicted kinase